MKQLSGENLAVGKSGSSLDCGDIISYNFGPNPDPSFQRVGHEQAYSRPALVITPAKFNSQTGFAWVCPITSSNKKFVYKFVLPSDLYTHGFVLLDQLKTIQYSKRNFILTEQVPLYVSKNVLLRLDKIVSIPSRVIPSPGSSLKVGGLLNPHYVPDSGHVISYTNKPSSSAFAVVLTPLPFNNKTKFAWVCPIVTEKKDYPFEIELPDFLKTKGFILVDQLNTLDWDFRKFEFVECLSDELVKSIICQVREIISSSP